MVFELRVDGVDSAASLDSMSARCAEVELLAQRRREDGHGERSGHAAAEDGYGLEQ